MVLQQRGTLVRCLLEGFDVLFVYRAKWYDMYQIVFIREARKKGHDEPNKQTHKETTKSFFLNNTTQQLDSRDIR